LRQRVDEVLDRRGAGDLDGLGDLMREPVISTRSVVCAKAGKLASIAPLPSASSTPEQTLDFLNMYHSCGKVNRDPWLRSVPGTSSASRG
jgi:hypothetical protein